MYSVTHFVVEDGPKGVSAFLVDKGFSESGALLTAALTGTRSTAQLIMTVLTPIAVAVLTKVEPQLTENNH